MTAAPTPVGPVDHVRAMAGASPRQRRLLHDWEAIRDAWAGAVSPGRESQALLH
jgi:hypothetical protein